MKAKELQKGVALYIALIVMSFLLAAGLGMTVIIVGQLKMMKGIGDSVVAFQAADTGIENALYNARKLDQKANIGGSSSFIPIGPANYWVSYFPTTDHDSWQSVGIYNKQRRSIQIDQIAPFDFTFTSEESSFCVAGDGNTGTILHAELVPPSSQQHVIFLVGTTLPTGVSVAFDPLEGDIGIDVDNVDFRFDVSGASKDTYSIDIIAHTQKKDHKLTFTLTIMLSTEYCPS